MKRKRFLIVRSSALLLLLIPFIAMQFNESVTWTIGDFVAMGILLLSLITVVEITLRKTANTFKRWAYLGAIGGVFLLIWTELAVGIF